VILQMLEITPALPALGGVIMELNDCAFPTLRARSPRTTQRRVQGRGLRAPGRRRAARPRHGAQGPAGGERRDLLAAGQGAERARQRNVKVLVVGNPREHDCAHRAQNAPDLDPRCFTAMTRLDHNRALSQLAEKSGAHTTDIRG
jgi:malate dehydrogenase